MPLSGPGGGIGAPGGGATTAKGASGGFWGGVGSFAKDNWQNIAAYGLSAYNAQRTNKQQRQLSQRQMDFQERMSSTAYQRSADDLEKAGLNRILAIGSPATTPGGSQPPKLEVPGRHGREGIATALQMGLIKAQIARTNAETAFTKSKTNVIEVPSQIGETAGGVIDAAKRGAEYTINRLKTDTGESFSGSTAVQLARKNSARMTPSLKRRYDAIDVGKHKLLKSQELTYREKYTPLQNARNWAKYVQKTTGKDPSEKAMDDYITYLRGRQK